MGPQPGEQGAWEAALAIGKGMATVFKQTFRPDNTERYPKEIATIPERSHIGRHRLNLHEDGLEKCIGCELCAFACPADAIWVEGADNDPEHPTSPGERYAKDYQINYLRCIMCGLCVEACPDPRAHPDGLLRAVVHEPGRGRLVEGAAAGAAAAARVRPRGSRGLAGRAARQRRLLGLRAALDRDGDRHDRRPQRRACRALPRREFLHDRGDVPAARRAVPVRGADRRLRRRDHGAVPVRDHAARRRSRRRGDRAAVRTAHDRGDPRGRDRGRARDGDPRGHRVRDPGARGLRGREPRREPVGPRRGALPRLLLPVRGDVDPADRRRGRGDGAGAAALEGAHPTRDRGARGRRPRGLRDGAARRPRVDAGHPGR